MTKEIQIARLRERINKLENRPINIKCGGVLKKLKRQLRLMEG